MRTSCTGTLVLRFVIVLVAFSSAVACGGAARPVTQSPSTSQSAERSNSSTATSAPTLPVSPSPRPPTPSGTPTVRAAAQPAVNVYAAFNNWLDTAERDPAHADVAPLASLASGDALQSAVKLIETWRANGIVWRGTPEPVNIKSLTVNPGSVTIAECQAVGSFLPFYAQSGKAVQLEPGSHPSAATVVRTDGRWFVATYRTDGSKTCSP
jgi:hypothetical protein